MFICKLQKLIYLKEESVVSKIFVKQQNGADIVSFEDYRSRVIYKEKILTIYENGQDKAIYQKQHHWVVFSEEPSCLQTNAKFNKEASSGEEKVYYFN